MSTIYINTPFTEQEYARIESEAKKEGRSKGQQLRHMALKALGFPPSPTKSSKSSKKKGTASK